MTTVVHDFDTRPSIPEPDHRPGGGIYTGAAKFRQADVPDPAQNRGNGEIMRNNQRIVTRGNDLFDGRPDTVLQFGQRFPRGILTEAGSAIHRWMNSFSHAINS